MLLPRINELPYSSSSPFVPFGILCDENEVVGWIRSVRDLVSEPGKVGYRLRRRPVKEDRPLGEKDHTVQLGEYRPGWLVDRHEARQSSPSDNLRHVRYEELIGNASRPDLGSSRKRRVASLTSSWKVQHRTIIALERTQAELTIPMLARFLSPPLTPRSCCDPIL